MITCIIGGGLGNQLFKIFTTINYAIKHNTDFWFEDKKYYMSSTNRFAYWDNLFIELTPKLFKNVPNEFENKKGFIYQEKHFHYDEIYIENNENNENTKNIILFGYFQSYKYFLENYDFIYSYLNIENKKIEIKNNNYHIDFNNTVSMHFRLGDYKKYKNIHPILTYAYYKNSIEYLKNENIVKKGSTILYFYENTHETVDKNIINKFIEFLKIYFQDISFVSINTEMEDWKQLLLMSCCHSNIIANSTFSWWGAYFNSNKNKKVVYPSRWFGEQTNNDVKDLFPEDWKKINII